MAFQEPNSYLKIYPHHPLYHISLPKRQIEFFVAQKSVKVLKLLRIFIDSVVFKFHSDRTFFRFFVNGILCRVLSDRVFSGSSVIGSSSGSVVFLVHECSFSAMPQFFFIKLCCYFFYFALISQNEVCLTYFSHKNKLRNTTCSDD